MKDELEFLREENKKLKAKIKILETFLNDALTYFDSISDEEQKKFGKRIDRYNKKLNSLN